MNLKDKTAIITGASKGIGLAIAQEMLSKGMKVLITGRSQNSIHNALEQIPSELRSNIIGKTADVYSMTDMRACSQIIVDKWGKIDVVVANAGIGHFASIEDLTEEQWNETINTNLTGVFNTVKTTVEELKKTKGYIITIASLAGTNFFAKGSAYNASKFGLVGFTQAIMLDLRSYGIKCTTIMPGSVSTYFNNHTPSEADAWKIQPEDIAQVVTDLLNIPQRSLPSKIEIRPTQPPSK